MNKIFLYILIILNNYKLFLQNSISNINPNSAIQNILSTFTITFTQSIENSIIIIDNDESTSCSNIENFKYKCTATLTSNIVAVLKIDGIVSNIYITIFPELKIFGISQTYFELDSEEYQNFKITVNSNNGISSYSNIYIGNIPITCESETDETSANCKGILSKEGNFNIKIGTKIQKDLTETNDIKVFIYIFSLTENPSPNSVLFNTETIFTLHVPYNQLVFSHKISIGNELILSCDEPSTSDYTILTCTGNPQLSKRQKTNETRYIYIDNKKTDYYITVVVPDKLEISSINPTYLVSYGTENIEFICNCAQIYDSEIIRISNIILNDCKYNDIYKILCKYSFDESQTENYAKVYIDDVEQTGVTISILPPDNFEKIYGIYGVEYVSDKKQTIYLLVNSAKNIFYKNIVLVPEDGNTDNFVTLTDCGLVDGQSSRHAQCFGIINVPSKYTVNIEYISQNDTEGNPLTITIHDSPSFINEVYNITPNEIELTTEPIVFILTVNFVTNLDHYLFSLIEIDSENVINLEYCSQVENTVNKIKCYANIDTAGIYYVYLNGIKQEKNENMVSIYNKYLTKLLKIFPNIIRFNEESVTELITFKFDSNIDYDLAKITLTPRHLSIHSNATIEYQYTSSFFYIVYKCTFYYEDTYFIYINNTRQLGDDVYVTSEKYTSIIRKIFPNKVNINSKINYTFFVDTNLGIETIKISLVDNSNNNNIIYFTDCYENKIDYQIGYCSLTINQKGTYNVYVLKEDGENIIQSKISVIAEEFPNIIEYNPKGFRLNKKEQSLYIYFDSSISEYINKIKFNGEKFIIEPDCSIEKNSDDKKINCKGKFNEEDNYHITINDFYFQENIIVSNEFVPKNIKFLKINFVLLILINIIII